ncbi:hypothetical protein ASG25_21775 [Rhizobium sp. Leaf384]|uniref:DUF6950 family protein n=1 Tax=Rhizobium sp. Leaf384 TaxID=1736358 RepID=UPI00071503CA|nr:hypothetical protein [Rhizobium sp. Leaf384]KQS79821.1 hypothetical protein ASG25_21775 [Rhizobium sp. Leaf384]
MIELKRLPLWVGPFNDVLDEMRRTPFDWKTNDCACKFAGRIVEVLTGENIYAEFDGAYDDAESAYRVMRGAGFKDLADMVAAYLPEYGHPSEAQIGDIMAIPTASAFVHGLGVLNGERIFTLGESGINHIDRSAATRAFRVG